MIDRVTKFIGEAREEFRHVHWPSRAEALRLTGVVIGISIGLALFLGLFDYIFGYLLQLFVVR